MTAYPSLYQINTRVRLAEFAAARGRPATLDDWPDAEWDVLAQRGFDWVWLLGVWRTGPKSRAVSRTNPDWRRGFLHALPDLREEDIAGSCFAVADYAVHPDFGGPEALARLRAKLRARGLKLLLDFVPNHMGLDHPWVDEHPDFFIEGTDDDLTAAPANWCRLETAAGPRILAYGRDPYFSGWPDTLQLNYGNPQLQEAMIGELLRVARCCDGVRCDMAMLLLPDVFQRTWGLRSGPFWRRAIDRVVAAHPDFLFLAEVYWDLEWEMQQQGFDFTYDKRLYDRLREGYAPPVRGHLCAGLDFQDHLARFLENHDEPRAAATFAPGMHQAAAAITFLAPGLRFFHEGQREGRTVHVSPHLVRKPEEPPNPELAGFYDRLLEILKRPVVRAGDWKLLESSIAWDGNWTWENFVAFAWSDSAGNRLLVVVNYSAHHSQCYLRLPWSDLSGRSWTLRDLFGEAVYERSGDDLHHRGLYLDVDPWRVHVFEVA